MYHSTDEILLIISVHIFNYLNADADLVFTCTGGTTDLSSKLQLPSANQPTSSLPSAQRKHVSAAAGSASQVAQAATKLPLIEKKNPECNFFAVKSSSTSMSNGPKAAGPAENKGNV